LSEMRLVRRPRQCRTKVPNPYKCIMGVMDVTYTELSNLLTSDGFFIGDISELCRAVRGYDAPKYDEIRRRIILLFRHWLSGLEKEGKGDGGEKFKILIRFEEDLKTEERSITRRIL